MIARRFGRIVGRLLILALSLFAATWLAVVAVVAFWPENRPPPLPGDAIICLGAEMSQFDPRLPGPASERRALTCAALHAAGVAPVVVFTGVGTATLTAADAMANRAIAAGLPAAAALREQNARSTIQNAAFSLAMLPTPPARVIVVSDAFHLPRAWAIFRAFGVADVALYAAAPLAAAPLPPHPDDLSMRWWIYREAQAIWFNAGRAAVYGAAGLFGIDRTTRIGWFN